LHFRAQLPDEAIGGSRFEAAGAERVLPLLVGQLREQVARPGHVIRRDAVAHELVVHPLVGKFDEAVVHAEDVGLPLEGLRIPLAWRERIQVAEGGARCRRVCGRPSLVAGRQGWSPDLGTHKVLERLRSRLPVCE
jgi:hypothetical protein